MDDRLVSVGRLIDVHRKHEELCRHLDLNMRARERARRYARKPGANQALARAAIEQTNRRRARIAEGLRALQEEADALVKETPDLTVAEAAVLWAG